jgi:hypothetical protein
MLCPSCGIDNPESSKFCSNCGAALAAPTVEIPPAAIELKRASQWTAMFTRFEVYIDEQLAGTIGNSEQVRFELSPGTHLLYLKLDNFVSQPRTIQLKAGETVQLVCGPKLMGLGINLRPV